MGRDAEDARALEPRLHVALPAGKREMLLEVQLRAQTLERRQLWSATADDRPHGRTNVTKRAHDLYEQRQVLHRHQSANADEVEAALGNRSRAGPGPLVVRRFGARGSDPISAHHDVIG